MEEMRKHTLDYVLKHSEDFRKLNGINDTEYKELKAKAKKVFDTLTMEQFDFEKVSSFISDNSSKLHGFYIDNNHLLKCIIFTKDNKPYYVMVDKEEK